MDRHRKNWGTVAASQDGQVDAASFRLALVDEIDECMVCGCSEDRPNRRLPSDMSHLACHEILNGPLRRKTITEPCSLLVACWACNSGPLNRKGEWPAARQLAVLQMKAPHYYDLERFNWLRNPRAPFFVTQDEVDEWRNRSDLFHCQ